MRTIFLTFFSLLSTLLAANTPSWMLDQINKDLKPFQKEGVSLESLNHLQQAHSTEHGVIRYKIIKGRVFYETRGDERKTNPLVYRRNDFLLIAFKKLSSLYPLPDVDFLASVADTPLPHSFGVPLLTFTKRKNEKSHVLFPDFLALDGYSYFDKEMKKGETLYPWRSKREQCFWRGATTGGLFSTDRWKSIPRSQLVLLSLKNPVQVDARFTILCQGAENNPEMLAMPQLKGSNVNPLDSLKYKYLIEVDGNSCSFSRAYWTLLSNSVVLKQTSDNIQWYYGALKPFVHYIPVAGDFSNLIKVMEWAQKNDAKAEQIAKNATCFVQQNLSDDKVYEYLYLLICKYAELQRFNPK